MLLIEPLANTSGGHWSESLPRLADAAERRGREVVVVGVRGVDSEIRTRLEQTGARVVTAPDAPISLGGLWLVLARWLERGFRYLRERHPQRSLPYQLELFSRCFLEAGSLRIGRAALISRDPATAVVLTANLTLHGSAAALSGVRHIRYLHELSRHESRTVRAFEWLFRGFLSRTWVFCTTQSVRHALRRYYPGIRSQVQPYALEDAGAKLTGHERVTARAELGLPEDAIVASLIGASWKAKDLATVARALLSVRVRFVLLMAGYPIDDRIVSDISSAHRGELRVISRHLTASELRAVHAASDFTIVSRATNGKESGVVLEAASRRVPIVVSDHDGQLAAALATKPWARVFRSGDPDSLASALDEVCKTPLAIPPEDAGEQLGMVRADGMLKAFDQAMTSMDGHLAA